MKSFLVDQDGYYGEFGGAYVPEILHKCVEELQNTYLDVIESEDFKKEFDQLLRDYVGRPSPLYPARRLSEKYGCKMYLKREDLNHTGAHKSITPSDKFYWQDAWVRNVSLRRPVPDSTGWQQPQSVP